MFDSFLYHRCSVFLAWLNWNLSAVVEKKESNKHARVASLLTCWSFGWFFTASSDTVFDNRNCYYSNFFILFSRCRSSFHAKKKFIRKVVTRSRVLFLRCRYRVLVTVWWACITGNSFCEFIFSHCSRRLVREKTCSLTEKCRHRIRRSNFGRLRISTYALHAININP